MERDYALLLLSLQVIAVVEEVEVEVLEQLAILLLMELVVVLPWF